MSAPKGAFTNLQSAKAFGSNFPFERAGGYIQRVDHVRYVDIRKGGFAVAIDKTILKVKHKPPVDSIPQGASATHAMRGHVVGEQITDFIDFRKDYADGAFKSFLMACFGVTDGDAINEEHGAMACDDNKQPCRGLVLDVENTPREAKDNPTIVYVRTNYQRVIQPSELATMLDAEGLNALGGEDVLAKMIEAETASES